MLLLSGGVQGEHQQRVPGAGEGLGGVRHLHLRGREGHPDIQEPGGHSRQVCQGEPITGFLLGC